jgi:phosphatidate phosphatase APP1
MVLLRMAVRCGPLATLLAMLLVTGCASLEPKGLVGRQQVVFFPSPALASDSGDGRVLVQGRIFEPATDSLRRTAFISVAASAMGIDPRNLEQSALFRERVGAFISDSEGRKSITVNLGDRLVETPPTDPAGFFSMEVALSRGEMDRAAANGRIEFESVPLASGNQVRYKGQDVVVPADGITVITDIDDTIKITDMRDPHQKLANTLYRPFKAVPGMSDLFQEWKRRRGGALHFHVVSAGPWQLQPLLSQFFESQRFPDFTWDMRSVDVTEPQVLLRELHPDPYPFKVAAIGAWMRRFPRQHVILLGDSGEKDPEVFARMLTQFPAQIDAVCIRDVSQEPRNADRYVRLFGANDKVRVFRQPSELRGLVNQETGSRR